MGLAPTRHRVTRVPINLAIGALSVKKFAAELAEFLRRHYPETRYDGWYRFSADIEIKGGEVDVEIPVLTRLPDLKPPGARQDKSKIDPLATHLPRDGEA
jgi:hypothetical protein